MKTDAESLKKLTQLFDFRWGIKLNEFKDQFHRTDMWFSWNGKIKEVEVKKRRFNSSKYKTTIINIDKYNELVSRDAMLVVMFDDCWYIFKNVKDAYVDSKPVWCRSTTDFEGQYGWSEKVELDLDKGIWFPY